MRRIGQRSSAEYIPRGLKRLKAISNLSSMKAYEYKHTNVNAVDERWQEYILEVV